MKSEQEVFDAVVHHLLTQQAKAADDDGACLYRGPKGRTCAVGCLILDEDYSGAMEGKGITMISVLKALRANGVLAVNDYELQSFNSVEGNVPYDSLTKVGQLLRVLQLIHDEETPDTWAACFRTLGRAHKLDVDGL